jgi:hypothetical protein
MSSSSDTSLLLWFLATLVCWLAAHVALGGLRDIHRAPLTLASARRPALLAGLSVGAALCTAVVLSLASQGLNVLVGFRIDAAAGLWVLAALGGVGIVAGLAWRRERLAWVAGGVALAVLAIAVQWGWVMAAGFRPGVQWSGKFLAAAGVLTAVGSSVALALGLGETAQHGRLRGRWRLAASVLMALSWVMGQELLLAGASLGTQVGSLYRQQLTAPLLSMVLGTLVPLALLVALFDQAQRRRQRSRTTRARNIPGRGDRRYSGRGRSSRRTSVLRAASQAAGASTQNPAAAAGPAGQPAPTIGGL